jgi:hypothetical protein
MRRAATPSVAIVGSMQPMFQRMPVRASSKPPVRSQRAMRLAVRVAVACALVLMAGVAVPAAASASAHTKAAEASAVAARGPVGWNSYRRLDLLPLIRRGVAPYQASSADPTGRNDDGYSGKYSCLHRVAQGCLMAEHRGPGELESVWTAGNQGANTAKSGRLMIELDGRMVVDATWPQLAAGSVFIFPLSLAPQESWGGSSIQVPMTFRHEMRVISQYNPHYFHVVYRTFFNGDDLQNAVSGSPNPPDVLAKLRDAGTRAPDPVTGVSDTRTRFFSLRPGQSAVVAAISGAAELNTLRLRFLRFGPSPSPSPSSAVTAAAGDVYRLARLRISFDGVRTIDAPIGEFFGSGLGPAKVRALMFAMDGTPHGWASSWWPMPFTSTATIEIDNRSHTTISSGELQARWTPDKAWTERLATGRWGYFHAYGHQAETRPGRYWTFLRTKGSGTFVGLTMTMEGGNPPYYLEGNERAYIDGSRKPQIQGTGTEDFFDGGWYFWDHLFTLPLSGYTAHETSVDGCPQATCKTTYRLMIADEVSFNSSILYEIQHGPEDQIQARYSSTAYWYQARPTRGHR